MLHEDTREGGLYLIRLSDTHYYGGRTRDFKVRWRVHLLHLKMGRHDNKWMQRVYDKHGRFEPVVLFRLPYGEQEPAEQAWLDANFRKPGCVNLSPIAKGGGISHSEEARKKRLATWWSNPKNIEKARATINLNRRFVSPQQMRANGLRLAAANVGRAQSPDHVEKRAAAHRGRKNTPETIALMSESAKRRVVEHPTSHGAETRALISSQQAGRVWINDGETSKRLAPGEAEVLLAQGWVMGRKPRGPDAAPYKNKGQPPSAAVLAGAKIAAEKRRGRAPSPEAIEKTASKNRGRKNTPEGLANLRAAGEKRRGRKRDPEVVARIAEARRGKKHSPEAIERMRLAKARLVNGVVPPNGICSSDFEVLRVFPQDGDIAVGDLRAALPHLTGEVLRTRLCRCKAGGLIHSRRLGRYRLSEEAHRVLRAPM